MKIILLISAMQDGGAESVASTLVNAWAERGDSVTLVATFSGRGKCNFAISEKVSFVYLADRVKSRGGRFLSVFSRLRALRSLIREIDADVLVSFLANVNISSIVASRGLGVPIIVCEHTNPLADRRALHWRLLCRWIYPRANLLTLLTHGVVEPFRRLVPGIKHIAVMPNPVPEGLFSERRGKPTMPDRKRLISLGRLHPCKQFELLIGAFASIADEFEDWDLWIWGEGQERAKLEAQIRQSQLGGRIFLPGRTLTPWREMAAAQAFALSSSHEGLPMAMMECMAIGLPIVAFDCPSGPRELTRNGQDGLLVPPGDARALATALRRLLSDEKLRQELGQRAAISVRERYSLGTILRMWDELFVQVGACARQ